MTGDVCSSQALQERPVLLVEVAQGNEVSGKGLGLVAGPRVEGGDQLRLVNQSVLEREQPKIVIRVRMIGLGEQDRTV